MSIKKIEKNTVLNLKREDFANFFGVYYNDINYFYNPTKDLFFKNFNTMSPHLYSVYTIEENDTWSNISYKIYGTIELWWLICKVNDIYNPLISPVAGNILKILNRDVVDEILNSIQND